ncbi:small multi-drug export protein [Candidatus Parcubacteria bacterium]|jgi:uncharacterized membrane protein|nr:small multi-drug export protein [Candidatus Parcubacteria bacterium]
MDLEWINHISPQLATFLLAMLPIAELRASIPIALENFALPIWQAFGLSVLGAFVPAVFIIYLIEPVSKYLIKHFKWAKKFFDWLFNRTRKRFAHKYDIWGSIALMIFVAIPLPVTGVWTGSLAAWLFGIEKRSAFLFIALGAIISGVIVTLLTLGISNIFQYYG